MVFKIPDWSSKISTTNVGLHVENKHVGSAVFTVEYVSFIAQTESLCGITQIEVIDSMTTKQPDECGCRSQIKTNLKMQA